jgi:putative transposase
VHWVFTIADRRRGWLTGAWHIEFRLLLLHTCARHALFCPAYCLMPDHLHLLLLGVSPTSDQQLAIRFLRHVNRILPQGFRLQHQAFEHVLTPDEKERGSFENVTAYIRENPVRAGLVERWTDWPHAGGMLPGYPELEPAAADFWQSFWRIYHASVAATFRAK